MKRNAAVAHSPAKQVLSLTTCFSANLHEVTRGVKFVHKATPCSVVIATGPWVMDKLEVLKSVYFPLLEFLSPMYRTTFNILIN